MAKLDLLLDKIFEERDDVFFSTFCGARNVYLNGDITYNHPLKVLTIDGRVEKEEPNQDKDTYGQMISYYSKGKLFSQAWEEIRECRKGVSDISNLSVYDLDRKFGADLSCAKFIFALAMDSFKKGYAKEECLQLLKEWRKCCEGSPSYTIDEMLENGLMEAFFAEDERLLQFFVEEGFVKDMSVFGSCFTRARRGKVFDVVIDRVGYLIDHGYVPTPSDFRTFVRKGNVAMVKKAIENGYVEKRADALEDLLMIVEERKKQKQPAKATDKEILDLLLLAGAKTEDELDAESAVAKGFAILKKNVVVAMAKTYIKKSIKKDVAKMQKKVKEK